jgi:hypothetical protein
MMQDGLVTWIAYKQSTVAYSLIDTEYIALSDAAPEAIVRSRIKPSLRTCFNI